MNADATTTAASAIDAEARRATAGLTNPLLLVAALTALGFAIRLAGLGQSLFGDELSTYWVVLDHHGLKGVWDVVHSDAEITPPLYFLLAKLTTQIKANPEMLRLPSLIAGTATIPLTYLLGARTIGKRGGAVAAALVTLSPFMIYYSTEARGYAVMIALMLSSTLCLLRAVEKGAGVRWWVAYGAFSCAAMYTHYTVAFVLAGQALWALWYHPPARRGVLLANLGAALAYLPWVSGAIADFNSPTTDVLSRLQPFNWGFIRNSLEHWLFAHPYGLVALDDIPGYPAFLLLGLGVLLGLGAALSSRLRQRRGIGISTGVGLVIVLALATPVGEALAGVVSTNLLGTRNLAASWPGFALLLAAIISCAANRPARLIASTAVIAAFAIAAVKMLQADHRRPDTREAAALISAQPPRSALVVDAAVISPGPYSSLDADLADPRYRVIRSGAPRQRSRPFRVTDDALTPEQAIAEVSRLSRRGTRVFAVVLPPKLGSISAGTARELEGLLPTRFHLEQKTVSPGMVPITTLVFRDRGRRTG